MSLSRLFDWVIEHRGLVLALTLLMAASGVISFLQLPFDAYPDTTPVMVQVNTVLPGYAAEDVEAMVTAPIEWELGGLAELQEIRSISKIGLSQVTLIFEDGMDIFLARQQISERIAVVELPEDIEKPKLSPASTGLGEIFHYIVLDTLSTNRPTFARETQDWLIKPQLRTVPGVAEVNSWGGYEKQFQVLINHNRLLALNLTLTDVTQAVSKGQHNIGGGIVNRAGERFIVQGVGAITGIEDIEQIVIDSRDGTPILVSDIADVVIGHKIRMATTTHNGEGEAVLGLGFMLTGGNSHKVAKELALELNEVTKNLPEGIVAKTVYDRTDFVDQVLRTVEHNLFFGATLVIAVLFLFLGNIRAAIIVALAIPLSMMFAFNMMLHFGIVGSLMSLGAIDFGLVVDNAVIQVENVTRRLVGKLSAKERLRVLRDAIMEVRKPTLLGELIIIIVYLPILALQGIEGKLFRPMALTVILALSGSMLLSLTAIPALCAFMLPARIKKEHQELWLVETLKRLYKPVLFFCLKNGRVVLASVLLLITIAVITFTRIGAEFIPRLSEGSIVVNLIRLSGISLEQSADQGTHVEKILKDKFPDEVNEIWTRTGTPEVATDPMGVELSDVFIALKPRDQWKLASNQQQLVELMDTELSDLPGMNMVFTQPIEMRFNEMIAGIRTDLGIKIFGDDLEILKQKADEVFDIVEQIEGAADLNMEQITGQPILKLVVDRHSLSRYSLRSEEVLEAIKAIGGIEVGEVRQGERRFEFAVKFDSSYTRSPEALDRILVLGNAGEHIPLSHLAKFDQTEGSSTITRERSKRRIVVQCNVRGRDIGSFVNEVRERLEKEVTLDSGYYIRYGGQFENLERARQRLMIVIPFSLLLIFGLLYITYKSVRDAILIFSGIPLAAVGGVFGLAFRGMPFTISAGVGFIALSGIAVLNGLVLIAAIRKLQEDGMNLQEAVRASGVQRLRPVIMTALVAALGFVPMAISQGVGAEVQRPLATVVISGILTSTALTLLVLPVIYSRWGKPMQLSKKQI